MPPEFFHSGGHMAPTKNIAVAQQQQNFQFYCAVVTHMLQKRVKENNYMLSYFPGIKIDITENR